MSQGVRELLKLIICEFTKLKRKIFIPLVLMSTLLFPFPLILYVSIPQHMAETRVKNFNEYFGFVMGYGVEMLLPCVIGVIAAMLFFMERDNDTFKNLRTIPVTSTQMIFAKITVLFFCGIAFSLISALAALLCGGIAAETEVTGVIYKLTLAVKMGIFITAGTLPLVVLVVFFSKTYIFSILLCVFYSILSLTAESGFGVLPKALCWLMPIPLTTLWSAADMIRHGSRDNIEMLEYLFPSTFQTAAILGVMAAFSVMLIDFLYKKRGEE